MTMSPLDALGDEITVAAEVHRPAGRRRHHLLLVRACPFCGCAHAHRTTLVRPLYSRSPSCAPWRTYWLTTAGAAADA